MIKFDKDEFLKPQIYSTNDEYETRCNVTKEIVDDIKQLQQENQELKKQLEVLEQENQKYKEAIDKAINELINIPINASYSEIEEYSRKAYRALKEVAK